MPPQIHPDAITSLLNGDHGDPFSLLGPHNGDDNTISIRAFQPHARELYLILTDSDDRIPMNILREGGFFEISIPTPKDNLNYIYEAITYDDETETFADPYAFPPQLTDYDLYLIGEGHHLYSYEKLGAHAIQIDGVAGVHFAVWAPNAYRVSVIGDFNRWDARLHPMRRHIESGIWEIFIPGLSVGDKYKFDLRSTVDGYHTEKTDPYAFAAELRPRTASIITNIYDYEWTDDEWMAARAASNPLKQPMSIYEVHLGSWRRKKNGLGWLTYRELADELVQYAKDMNYTHLELMPIAEHPFDGSWGYQVTGYYAVTSRFGTPQDFMYFVDTCHRNGIGIILDWVPAHFPKDGHALSYFDGTHLYEHADVRQGEHPDWGTYIFNYGRNEVRNFLISNALFWLKEYHIDGLRVDAVASMLYLDFSRKDGEWIPNEYGGNENLPAITFMQEMNAIIHKECPGAVTIAEESTAWPMVSRPTYLGGLGFTFKWNMGWMHDTLEYLQKDPIYRPYHHHNLTFSLVYAFSENFVLSLSHDEVVHGKGSLINKIAGDWWQKFATLRLLFGYMVTHPGKKLVFMGGEFGQWNEWSEARSLDWHLLDLPTHAGLQAWVRDLNRFYQDQPALYVNDVDPRGFQWLEANDAAHSVYSYLRFGEDQDDFLVVVFNFTPVPHLDYRIGVPQAGYYQELLNSDAAAYGGGNLGNDGGRHTDYISWHNHPQSLNLTIPPLGIIILKLDLKNSEKSKK